MDHSCSMKVSVFSFSAVCDLAGAFDYPSSMIALCFIHSS